MKKILFLLVLIYNYSFSAYTVTDYTNFINYINSPYNKIDTSSAGTGGTGGSILFDYLGSYQKPNLNYGSRYGFIKGGILFTVYQGYYTNPRTLQNYGTSDGLLLCTSTGCNEIANPDPLVSPSGSCRDLFQKDGVAYTCNPNTNEATPIPNSSGTMTDPTDGKDIPKCNDGYEYTATASFPQQGSTSGGYTSWGCSASTGTGDTGSNNGGSGTGTGEPSISYGGDGSVTMTLPDGTKQTTYGDGWVTTTYPDGTTSSTAPSSSFGTGGGSSGGSGTSGGGGGTSGNTTNETTPTPTEDTPIDNTPVATSCSDSALTLQEKMLCELNAGMKKQNSEGNPSNSLNQLLKDLKTSNQTDNTAINTNLKDIESGTVQLVNKQTQANTTLDKINNSANATELYTKTMNDGINKISGTLDGIAEFITTVSDFVKDPSQIGDLMNNKLGEVTSKYQSKILNDSCGVCPTITIPYHGSNVTLLSQSLLDNYFPIALMKTVIILTFAFAGFMNFFRSNN